MYKFLNKAGFLSLLLAILFQAQLQAQTATSLPRSTPEAEGMSSKVINAFLDSVAASQHEFHSFMLLRHGKVIAEGWWQPYRPDLKHTLYSLSKSFTATAVGFARAEGKLALTDKVISFFPEAVPDTASNYLKEMDVKDLLTMSVGQEPDPTGRVVQDSNWVKSFLRLPIKYKPGSRFLYNSMATYMLSAIVQKATGEKVLDYLKPRLFEPLGITGMDWETDLQGINTGGWGLRLKTEDIAKFAQLFLQKGAWNGQQLLPKGWAEEASTAHIIQHPEMPVAQRSKSDWEQGYGYQMWRSKNGAYRGDGAFGQYALVMPEQDAVIAITSETGDMQGVLNLIWKVLLPAMKPQKLTADAQANASLKQKLAQLALRVSTTAADTSMQKSLDGKVVALEPNKAQMQSLAFRFHEQKLEMIVKKEASNDTLRFASGQWQQSQTALHGPYLVAGAQNSLVGLAPFKVAGAYHWRDANTLELQLRYIESPHTQTWLCHIDNNNIKIELKRSFAALTPDATVVLKGVVQ